MTFLRGAIVASCAAAALCGVDAWAQPTRTIRVVVAAPPGGASDVLARLLADQIGRTQAVTMIVEAQP